MKARTALSKLFTGAGRVVLGLLFLLWFFLGFRGCAGTTWMSPAEVESYTAVGDDGRTLTIVFLPENEVLLSFTDPYEDYAETALTMWRGEGGKWYPFNFFHFPDAPMSGLNWRRGPANSDGFFLESTVLEKYVVGSGAPVFPEKKDFGYLVVFFSEDRSALLFEGTVLDLHELNPLTAGLLASQISDSSAVAALASLSGGLFDPSSGFWSDFDTTGVR